MIYHTNVRSSTPHMAFVGRWSPFHKGHAALILQKIRANPNVPILIMVRDTSEDKYSSRVRAEYVKTWMVKNHISGTIMIIPNIEGIYWGRGVGYKTERVDLDPSVTAISASNIRTLMTEKKGLWRTLVANGESSHLLTPKISSIVERGMVVWLTGCPSSGKTTIANALISYAQNHFPHLKTQLLDGDAMRSSPLAQHVGYSRSERQAHLRRMGYLASLFANHGILVVCAFVSPYEQSRNEVRRIIGKERYIEIYVRASKRVRLARDTKGLYRKAAHGELQDLTGYNDTYEEPVSPTLVCDTGRFSLDRCVQKICQELFYEK